MTSPPFCVQHQKPKDPKRLNPNLCDDHQVGICKLTVGRYRSFPYQRSFAKPVTIMRLWMAASLVFALLASTGRCLERRFIPPPICPPGERFCGAINPRDCCPVGKCSTDT